MKQSWARNLRKKVTVFLALAAVGLMMFAAFFIALTIIPAPGPSAQQLAAGVSASGPIEFSGELRVRSGPLADSHQFKAYLAGQELRVELAGQELGVDLSQDQLELGGVRLPLDLSALRLDPTIPKTRAWPGPEIGGQATWKLEFAGPLVEGPERISPLLAPKKLTFYFPRSGDLPLRVVGRWQLNSRLVSQLEAQLDGPLELVITTERWKVQKES